MTILLLTKSLAFEQDFVREVNDLGHEILCSKKFLRELQTKDYFGMDLNYFETLIFSETISDQEVTKILPLFQNFSCAIFRKTKNQLTPEMIHTWKDLGVQGFLSQNTHFDELREELIACDQRCPKKVWETSNTQEARLENLLINFSNQELQVFKILQESGKKYISREDLSEKLWGEPPTKSKESRLSGIIRSIKSKLANYGFDESCLETSWGRGYRIDPIKLRLETDEVSGELKVIEL